MSLQHLLATGDDAQTLLDFSNDMLALLAPDLCYVRVNAAFAAMFGLQPDALVGRSSREMFAHEIEHHDAVILPCMQQALDGKEAHFESWIAVPGFGDMYLDIRYLPVRAKDGSVCGCAVVGRDRTEIMHSIEALKRSEKLLNRTEHIAHLGGWFYEIGSDTLDWTDEMYEIHEVGKDFQLTQANIQRFVPADELPKVHAGLQRAMQGQPTEIISGTTTATGRRIRVRSIAFPVIENGKVVSIEGVLQDITELSTTQERLQQSEEKYRRLVEETNALVWEGNVDPPCFTYISPQAEKLTGFATDEWMQPGFLWERVLPEEREETFATINRKVAAGEDFIVEYRFIRADGSIIWLHDDVKVICDEQGRPVHFRGVMIDITRMKEMQTGLSRALRALENHKYIMDRHAIVASADREGRIDYVNSKFIEITGYEREELIGQRHSMLKSGVHGEVFYRKLWDTIAAGQVWQGELCNRRKNGELYWVYTTIVPLRDEQGQIEEFMSVSTEITELKRTEESLRRAQKMEAIGQLTGGIAHDFNNLLSIVIGNIELVEMGLPPDERLQRQLENARNAALRGSVLTRRLLNFSHQAPVLGQATDLNRVMRGIEVLVSKSLTALVQVELDLADDLWLVEVDPGDFEDAIINLSLNASDAMPQGGKLRFRTRNVETTRLQFRNNGMMPPGQYVELVVEDNGIGMHEEVLDKIFEPYFTTKPSDKGSGLGLPMVYGFVKRSKGLIFVDSTPGTGTRFTIYLPKSRHQNRTDLPHSAPATAEKLAARNDETILLVDDEADILKITRANLEHLGYRVLVAGSGDEALQVLRDNPSINLMFTDIVMPGTHNGFELAEAAQAQWPALKILFTTGYAKVEGGVPRPEWRERIIHKPYRSAEVSRRIRAMLDEAQANT